MYIVFRNLCYRKCRAKFVSTGSKLFLTNLNLCIDLFAKLRPAWRPFTEWGKQFVKTLLTKDPMRAFLRVGTLIFESKLKDFQILKINILEALSSYKSMLNHQWELFKLVWYPYLIACIIFVLSLSSDLFLDIAYNSLFLHKNKLTTK